MATAVAVLFALGFYTVTTTRLRRTQRMTGRNPLVVLRYGNAEEVIAAVALWLFPLVLIYATLQLQTRGLRPFFDGWFLPLLAAAVLAGGLVLQYVAMQTLGRALRVGIDPEQREHLVRHGPYRLIRHPIYTAFMCYFVGAWLLRPNAVFSLLLPIALVRITYQALREERALLQTFGPEYAAYARTTSRFIPGIW